MEESDSYLVNIEGARLQVCFKCRSLGKTIREPGAPSRGFGGGLQGKSGYSAQPRLSGPSMRMEFELVENYGQIVRSAREQMGLPLGVLAEKIAEKESFLERIEKQKTSPPISVAKKLEKELGIKILEETGEEEGDSKPLKKSSSAGLTLGDILEIEKKKKK
jgi:putative transcription factor